MRRSSGANHGHHRRPEVVGRARAERRAGGGASPRKGGAQDEDVQGRGDPKGLWKEPDAEQKAQPPKRGTNSAGPGE